MAGLFGNLSSLFSSGGKNPVGLSIGSSSIKLAELTQKGKLWKLLRFGSVQLPEEVIVNREIVNPVALVECIKTLTNQMQLKSPDVCIAISGNALIVKKMTSCCCFSLVMALKMKRVIFTLLLTTLVKIYYSLQQYRLKLSIKS
jgi:hypothetical protein